MKLPKPSANTLIDQTFLGQIIDEVNTISDNYSKASSSIFDTSTNKSKTTYFGGFSFVTIQKEITQTLSSTKNSVHTETITFDRDFLAPPLVFATIETQKSSGTGSTPSQVMTGVTVNDVNKAATQVTVVIDPVDKGPTIKYKINILAIGLSTPLRN